MNIETQSSTFFKSLSFRLLGAVFELITVTLLNFFHFVKIYQNLLFGNHHQNTSKSPKKAPFTRSKIKSIELKISFFLFVSPQKVSFSSGQTERCECIRLFIRGQAADLALL